MSYFQKEHIEDYIVFNDLSIKTDSAYFDLRYEIEGVSARGTFIKISREYVIKDNTVSESSIQQAKPIEKSTKKMIAIKRSPTKVPNLGIWQIAIMGIRPTDIYFQPITNLRTSVV